MKKVKIGIHFDPHPNNFCHQWIEYCNEKGIEYKLLNFHSSTIIQEVEDCNVVMWHWYQSDKASKFMALSLIYSLELSGKIVFPNLNTCFYFDNKIGQKYLFNSLKIQTPKTEVFFSKKEALLWLDNNKFPFVNKLSGGAGSVNVSLIKNKAKAKRIINKLFGKGVESTNYFNKLKDKYLIFKEEKSLISFINFVKGIGRYFFPNFKNHLSLDKGYFYVQEYISNQGFDIRVVVIGDEAFAIKRLVRKNDFRASGSGKIIYDHKLISLKCIEIAFDISQKMKSQSLAVDFVGSNDNWFVLEISYGFVSKAYYNCDGVWDKDLNWRKSKVIPEYMIIRNLINNI